VLSTAGKHYVHPRNDDVQDIIMDELENAEDDDAFFLWYVPVCTAH
jgi:hypothetical protein